MLNTVASAREGFGAELAGVLLDALMNDAHVGSQIVYQAKSASAHDAGVGQIQLMRFRMPLFE